MYASARVGRHSRLLCKHVPHLWLASRIATRACWHKNLQCPAWTEHRYPLGDTEETVRMSTCSGSPTRSPFRTWPSAPTRSCLRCASEPPAPSRSVACHPRPTRSSASRVSSASCSRAASAAWSWTTAACSWSCAACWARRAARRRGCRWSWPATPGAWRCFPTRRSKPSGARTPKRWLPRRSASPRARAGPSRAATGWKATGCSRVAATCASGSSWARGWSSPARRT